MSTSPITIPSYPSPFYIGDQLIVPATPLPPRGQRPFLELHHEKVAARRFAAEPVLQTGFGELR